MKKILKWLGILLGGVLAFVLVVGLIAPKSSHVAVRIFTKASAQNAAPLFQKWENWDRWSPWKASDSTMKVAITGTSGTVGSRYDWMGENTGEGSMTVTEIDAYSLNFDLAFNGPLPSTWKCKMEAQDTLGGSTLSWTFDGESPYPFNAFSYLFNMENYVRSDFEKGLKSIGSIAEGPVTYDIEMMKNPGLHFLINRATVKFGDIPAFFGERYGVIYPEAEKLNIKAGTPCGLFFTYNSEKGETDMAAAAEVPERPKQKSPLITAISIDRNVAPTLLKINYYGPYEGTGTAHEAMDVFMKQENLVQVPPVIERYVTDPGTQKDPNKVLTEIIYAVKKKN
jgi:effector-binding domain-containing protein